jgi:hypothetical protein
MGGFTGKIKKPEIQLGQAIPMIGENISGKYKLANTVINRSDYPELSTAYPTTYGIRSNSNVTLSDSQHWSSIATDGSIQVMVSGRTPNINASPPASLATANISISLNDGETWTTQVGVLPASQLWTAIAYGDGKFVAVSYTAGTTFATNTPAGIIAGTAWTISTASVSARYSGIAYCQTAGQERFVAISAIDATACYMNAGSTTWTTISPAIGISQELYSFKWIYDRLIACGTSGGTRYSFNGLTWVLASSTSMHTCIFDGTHWVFVNNTTTFYKSAYASISTLTGYSFPVATHPRVMYSQNAYFAFPYYNAANFYYSVNGGSSWSSATLPAGYYFAMFNSINNKIFVVSANSPTTGYFIDFGYNEQLTLTGPSGYYVRVKP